jgi:hypothetical protein
MKIKFLPLILLPFLFSACGNQSHGQEKIELNNGKKWAVNEEMKPHIEQGRVILNTYLTNGDTDHEKLANDLKEQNSKLIKSCTMEGKSHDELHKWLHPHIELLKELSKAETPDEVTKVTEQLKASYDLYDQHFE